jgi:TolA-binding protein
VKDSRRAKEKKTINFFSFQVLALLSLGFLSSCSYFKGRNQVQNPEVKNAPKPLDVVPKVQYDQLLAKYEKLLDKKKTKSQKTPPKSSAAMADELVETVDIFDSKKETVSEAINTVSSQEKQNFSKLSLERQIELYQKAEMLGKSKKYDESMIILRELENTSQGQIKVRVKYLIGHLLFEQKEYDLSMQKFEEIISQHSFSGVVIKTLRKLIQCSQALGLDKKRERYYSILHDFFES